MYFKTIINIFRLINTVENWIKMSEKELTEGNISTVLNLLFILVYLKIFLKC